MAVLHSLTLHAFRNATVRSVQFDPRLTLIVGPNAQGKTAVLEALSLTTTGKSFRADRAEEMIAFGQELAQVVVTVTGADQEESEDVPTPAATTEIEVMITRGTVQGRRTQALLYSVNKVRRRKKDAIMQWQSVVFRPEDLRLMEGSPSRRRQFLDGPLSQVFPAYAQALTNYEQTLTRRNKTLQSVRDGEMPRTVLHYWTQQLLLHGQLLQEYRRQLVAFAAEVSFPIQFSWHYQPSVLTAERVSEYAEREIAAGHTLIGPHKDDFMVKLHHWPRQPAATIDQAGWPVSVYGSRGQQRLAVLWLKHIELLFIYQHLRQRPVLLLDDIFSELDDQTKLLIQQVIHDHQTVITTTDEELAQLQLADFGQGSIITL